MRKTPSKKIITPRIKSDGPLIEVTVKSKKTGESKTEIADVLYQDKNVINALSLRHAGILGFLAGMNHVIRKRLERQAKSDNKERGND
jgi:hypothetical protein